MNINVEAISEATRTELCKYALNITAIVFSDPGEEERYQEWLAKRRKERK